MTQSYTPARGQFKETIRQNYSPPNLPPLDFSEKHGYAAGYEVAAEKPI
jgi:hypothetical protein